MSAARCVYGCRRPLWALFKTGEGVCVTDDDPTVDDKCLCDAGFESRDSFGHPSCVPYKVSLAAMPQYAGNLRWVLGGLFSSSLGPNFVVADFRISIVVVTDDRCVVFDGPLVERRLHVR